MPPVFGLPKGVGSPGLLQDNEQMGHVCLSVRWMAGLETPSSGVGAASSEVLSVMEI